MGHEAPRTFQAIQRHLARRRGLDLSRYKESYLRRRLLVRVRALRLKGLDEYAGYVVRHPEEVGPLLRALSIKVTGFFRNRSCFSFLRETVVPDLIARSARRGGRVAVWSAGCASGEEAYSVAALFADALGRRGDVRVRVLGTDIDLAALERARQARFTAEALARSAPDGAGRFFETGEAGAVTPTRRLRRMVAFCRESLLDRFEREDLDLILCRNVLIYFSLDHQATILSRFAGALSPGGYLVLGRVERLFGEARTLFEVASARDRVYRRCPAVPEGTARALEATPCA
ncbi:MAG: CheR family methyltransferase [Acidobacteriota bacterium]